jgi:glycerate dehydrogenase
MNIVLTDCSTVNADDLGLSALERFGKVTYYSETPKELTAERIKDADIVIINKTLIEKEEIDAASHLKLIALFATGYNNVDVQYARQKGITVCNAGSYSTFAVAQQVFGYILSHACQISQYDADVKKGDWIASRLFCFFSRPTSELYGKTLGIFGYGTIGKKVAEIANAFGMKVIACTRTIKNDDTVTFVDFDTLLSESDYLTVHCPLTDATKERFNAEAFAKMKKSAYFINTARGGVICEQALADALNGGILAGAAVDVLTTEPMKPDCPLLHAANITITPHIAWAGYETRVRLMEICKENLKAFSLGNPINVVY